jgi:hypothetical protein
MAHDPVPSRNPEPTEFTKDTTVTWIKVVSDHQASDGWTLSYRFIGCAPFTVADGEGTITVETDGDDFKVTIPKADTNAYQAGKYDWSAFVEKAGEKFQIDCGRVEIKEDPFDITTKQDIRTHAERTLDALQAVIENRASIDQQQYTIAGRTLIRMSPEQLTELERQYRRRVAEERRREAIKNGRRDRQRIDVRFGKANAVDRFFNPRTGRRGN